MGGPIADTDDTTITYRFLLNSDFQAFGGGPTVPDIVADITEDREFALLITVSADTLNTDDGKSKVFNTTESFDNGDISFELQEVPKPVTALYLGLGGLALALRRKVTRR